MSQSKPFAPISAKAAAPALLNTQNPLPYQEFAFFTDRSHLQVKTAAYECAFQILGDFESYSLKAKADAAAAEPNDFCMCLPWFACTRRPISIAD
ncbi:hypothetical protein CW304_30145 [Bacillus sp. UFRGS-B20]|nr:hypothetical protein CW304_30145 [Bacillus sp. UFRGS-B20]